MWRQSGKGTNRRKRNGWKSEKSNEEVKKGQGERDKSQRGEGGKAIDGIDRGERCLTVAGSYTVSALVGNRPCPLAPLYGPEYQLLPNGVHLACPSHCSPAGHTSQQIHGYDMKLNNDKKRHV